MKIEKKIEKFFEIIKAILFICCIILMLYASISYIVYHKDISVYYALVTIVCYLGLLEK